MSVFFGTTDLPPFQKPVLTIGTFDGVHFGHRTILQKVQEEAERIGGESVLITFHPHPRSVLQPSSPLSILTPLTEKIRLLQEAGIDHIVVVPFTKEFAALSAEEYIANFLVKQFQPCSLVIGYDHHFGHDRVGNLHTLQENAERFNYEVLEIPARLIEDAAVSSTKVRKALAEGDVEAAAEMLARNYSLEGTVVHGDALGRTIGYPTANLEPEDPTQALPGDGIYAAIVFPGNEEQHNAMVSIGVRPTVTSSGERKIEAAILDFSADLYDQKLRILFIKKIRDQQKFSSMEELKAAIAQDERAVRAVLAS